MAGSDFKPYTSKGVKAFSCPNCGGQVEVRAPGQSLTAVCGSCRTVIDPNDPNYRILQKAKDVKRVEPKIPLGHRGMIEGIEWEMIGFMVRRNLQYRHDWEEYLLFNPIHGFRFLVQDSGHWTLTKNTLKPAATGSNRSYVKMGDKSYKRFSSGKARVMYVEGEFYWDVKRGDEVQTIDYIKPPYMLSVEHGKNEQAWAIGEYMKPSALQGAFGKSIKTGSKRGVGANQPNPASPALNQIVPVWGLLMVGLIIVQFLFSGISKNTVVLKETGLLTKATESFQTDTFEIQGGVSNLEVFLNSNVSNQWVEIEGTLTALEGEREYGFIVSNSYYAGVSGGESWSEGSRKENRVMNSVQAGKYRLTYKAYTGLKEGSSSSVNFELKIKRDVPIWSNFWLFAIILSLPVIILFIWQSSFESTRWES